MVEVSTKEFSSVKRTAPCASKIALNPTHTVSTTRGSAPWTPSAAPGIAAEAAAFIARMSAVRLELTFS